MKSLSKILAVTLLFLFTVQCEVIDSGLLDSPNAVTPENVDANFLLNNIQLSARGIYSGAALRGSELTRQRRLFGGTYSAAYVPQDMNAVHQTTYSSVFIDVQNLLPIAEANEQFFHMGMGQFFKAYGLITMVDMFGDMPYSEALDAQIFNPKLDDAASIYSAALDLLDQAVANFKREDRLAFPPDLYYPQFSGDAKVEAWVKAANTLKLKAYVNMRHVDPGAATAGINALLADDIGMITSRTHDFTFEYSTNDTNPDSRHPLFTNNYLNGANDYIGVSIMNMMLTDKVTRDPRIRYYFYRQRTQNTNDQTLQQCLGASAPGHYTEDDVWCQLVEGYWGEGHLNTNGIPPDTFLRTVFGVYPAGGRFDANQGQGANLTHGLQGAGIRPILMSFLTHFLLAEAALTLDGVALDARQLLEDAVRLSIQTVHAFGAPVAVADFVPTQAIIDSFVAEVMAQYDADPLRTIAKELYIASFPNGIEAWNVMRRTGFPNRADGIQPAQNASPGNWFRSLPYPANLVNRNSSVSQKTGAAPNHVRVFWDVRGSDDEFDF
jgi:hypothetical protein